MKRITLIFSIIFALLMAIDWASEQRDYKIKPQGALLELKGTLVVVRPWKTSDYMVLVSDGVSYRLSCSGPYGRGYWCNKSVVDEIKPNFLYNVRYDQFNGFNYVYEIVEQGRPVVVYREQVELFEKAIMGGPLYSKLIASIILGSMSLAFLMRG